VNGALAVVLELKASIELKDGLKKLLMLSFGIVIFRFTFVTFSNVYLYLLEFVVNHNS